jgi:hypothetical protein
MHIQIADRDEVWRDCHVRQVLVAHKLASLWIHEDDYGELPAE